jgi:preprotein translocase subunit SecY
VRAFAVLWNKIINGQYDLVLATRILPFGLLSLLISPFIKSKIIIQVHGTEITGRFNKGWRKSLLKFSFNRAKPNLGQLFKY